MPEAPLTYAAPAPRSSPASPQNVAILLQAALTEALEERGREHSSYLDLIDHSDEAQRKALRDMMGVEDPDAVLKRLGEIHHLRSARQSVALLQEVNRGIPSAEIDKPFDLDDRMASPAQIAVGGLKMGIAFALEKTSFTVSHACRGYPADTLRRLSGNLRLAIDLKKTALAQIPFRGFRVAQRAEAQPMPAVS